ncbi:MAG: anti-sigma factor [Anaerolineales bacterium]|nr:anti-sigma factor [Anaerolineales bacterium]
MNKQIEELLPFYALNALTDEERDLVESYLLEHPEARQQIEEMGGAVSSLPYSLPPVEPSTRTKQALMARVAVDQRAHPSTQGQPSRPPLTRLNNIFQAFSLGVAAVAIIWAVILNIQLSRLQNQVSSLGDALIAQENSLEQINAKLPQVTPSGVVTISLSGTTSRPDAHGQLIADPNSHSAILVIAGLATLEPGKTYQVWFIEAGGPVSAGLLTVDENGQAVLILTAESAIGSFNSIGISIEPEGGNQQPTGEIVVYSDL